MSGGIDALLRAYERHVRLPWASGLSGAEKVWLAVYSPSGSNGQNERRLRFVMPEFDIATTNSGHGWKLIDLTYAFDRWLGAHEYRDAYFANPEALEPALGEFGEYLRRLVEAELIAPEVDEDTVVALLGVGALFGVYRVSQLIEAVSPLIRGRLLVFFPGEKQGNNYRLLDARDGWNYLAVPIVATEG
jgi:hypothetical protein